MPDKPTHQWYWDNLSAYRDFYNKQAPWNQKLLKESKFNSIMANLDLNDPLASAKQKQYYYNEWQGLKSTVKQFETYFQDAKYVNQMAQENYNSLYSLKQASDKAAADQLQTVQLAQQQQAQQQQQIGAQRLATQAVSQSLRMLAGMATQAGAPAAAVTRRSAQGLRIRPTGARNSLRIGSSGRGAGVGVNLGG